MRRSLSVARSIGARRTPGSARSAAPLRTPRTTASASHAQPPCCPGGRERRLAQRAAPRRRLTATGLISETPALMKIVQFALLFCALALPLTAAPRALDPEVNARARALAASSNATAELARQTLHGFSLRHRQIRNALNEFRFHSDRMVELSALANVDPGVLRKAMSNLRMWGGTVDWHLDNGKMSASIRKVADAWSRTVVVWKRLQDAVPHLRED